MASLELYGRLRDLVSDRVREAGGVEELRARLRAVLAELRVGWFDAGRR